MCRKLPAEHLILETLRRFSFTVRQYGTMKDGYMPLDKLETATSNLHYGTLVIFTNNPNKMDDFRGQLPQEIKLKRHDIDEKTMHISWAEAAKALEVLEFNCHISETNKGQGLNMEERIISLTKKGLQAYNTDYYIKEQAKTLHEKTLYIFGRAAIAAAFLSLGISIASAVIDYLEYKKEDTVTIKTEVKLPQSENTETQYKKPHTIPTPKNQSDIKNADTSDPKR